MFLIEIGKGSFVDAEKIDCINIYDGKVTFTINGDIETLYSVSTDYNDKFLNHLGAMNNNPFANLIK